MHDHEMSFNWLQGVYFVHQHKNQPLGIKYDLDLRGHRANWFLQLNGYISIDKRIPWTIMN